MSYAYNTEPPTKGKVILRTTVGELEIELWPKEAPKACRNFVQLCLEGFYDNTIFHRVVPDFIAQGGDPTGTGLGGESIYGAPFADEYHTRLRFTHRGLLAMANTGPNSNTSQFFFTLGKTEELNHKNTIFGKIVGDTIYNMLKIGELEIGDDERPIYPAKIINSHVMSNPFDDIIPREVAQSKTTLISKEAARLAKEQEASKPKAIKNTSLLSFGDDEEESIGPIRTKHKIVSMHDAIDNDPRLSKQNAVCIPKDEDVDRSTHASEKQVEKSKVVTKEPERRRPPPQSDSDESDEFSSDSTKSQSILSKRQEEIRKISGQINSIGKQYKQTDSKNKNDKSKKVTTTTLGKSVPCVSDLRKAYLASGKAVSGKRKPQSTSDALSQLEAFQKRLRQESIKKRNEPSISKTGSSFTESEQRNKLSRSADDWQCDLHFVTGCQSCRDTLDNDDDMDDAGWMTSTLVFAKDLGGANVYEPKLDDYSVFDPRQDPSLGGGSSEKNKMLKDSRYKGSTSRFDALHQRNGSSSRNSNEHKLDRSSSRRDRRDRY
ncbi:Peptidyl-prolyl isomerase cwc27 [Batrachochytrium dendrobatidis]|nr:Peptidyl-prolyl isomerase cwc27 [Batrachochytrium dendrobatidis]KAK5672130.1 Peptidyl-prolyl isomerase cwc27 [Batrachochytrium dendrobatidis]